MYILPARRAGVSLGVAVKRTKDGSVGEAGRYDPTSTSLASEGGGGEMTSGSRATDPFKNSLLERALSCKLESWWGLGENFREERGVENGIFEGGFGVERMVESEEIAAIFEVKRKTRERFEGMSRELVGQLCSPIFVIRLG